MLYVIIPFNLITRSKIATVPILRRGNRLRETNFLKPHTTGKCGS